MPPESLVIVPNRIVGVCGGIFSRAALVLCTGLLSSATIRIDVYSTHCKATTVVPFCQQPTKQPIGSEHPTSTPVAGEACKAVGRLCLVGQVAAFSNRSGEFHLSVHRENCPRATNFRPRVGRRL